MLGAGSTGLDKIVEKSTEIAVVGLAQDFCVGFTCLDSLSLGFHTTMLVDLARPVRKESGEEMIGKVERAGGQINTFQEWKQELGSWKKTKCMAEYLLVSPKTNLI